MLGGRGAADVQPRLLDALRKLVAFLSSDPEILPTALALREKWMSSKGARSQWMRRRPPAASGRRRWMRARLSLTVGRRHSASARSSCAGLWTSSDRSQEH
jgi:hypothetical protein